MTTVRRMIVDVPFGTLVNLLRERSASDTGRVAYTFLTDGEAESQSVTYGELDARATTLAARLQTSVRPGDRVVLLCPPGLEFIEGFFACLYAGAIAVPAFPPDPRAPQRVLRRVDAIAADCSPTAVLTTPQLAAHRDILARYAPALAAARVLTADGDGPGDGDGDGAGSGTWRVPRVRPEDVAFLQYTSGSTGDPKGVVLSHANLLRNEVMIRSAMPQGPDSVLVSWLPLFHDMGLIGVVLYTAFLDARAVLMDPQHFLREPARWLRAVSRHRGTLTGSPNFGFELCLRKIDAAERERLDLSSVEVLFNGAEPVRPDTMHRFAAAFAGCGLRAEALAPCYGLAEATLMVSSRPRGAGMGVATLDPAALASGSAVPVPAGAGRELVSCGPAAGDQGVVVVDPDSRVPVPPGAVGEVWVAGGNVALGYWNRPADTAEVFGAELADATAPIRYLRTGDLGFLLDGEVYIVGRLKDLLIVRGRNLAPQDLERSIEEAHPALRRGCGAVFQVPREGADPLLVAVQEADPAVAGDPAGVGEAARAAVARDAEVDLDLMVLIAPRTIPKTSSGKIQRRACRHAFETGRLDELGRWTAPRSEDAAGELAERIEAYLSTRLAGASEDAASVDAAGSLADLGVDSLRAAELRAALEREFGVSVPLAGLLEGTSVAALAARLAKAAGTDRPDEPPVVAQGAVDTAELPLSDGQLALWYLHEREPDSHAYHITSLTRVRHGLDAEALHRALDVLVDRHEALRTRFGQRGGVPYQQVLAARPVDFTVVDTAGWSQAEVQAALAGTFEAPFQLGDDPLLRVRVYRNAPDDQLLALAVHHIIADFWSLAIFATELGTVYRALSTGETVELAPLAYRYADYVRWQAQWLASPAARPHLEAWTGLLTPEPAALELPTDRPRPPVQTERGASETTTLPQPLAERVRRATRELGVTEYTLFLTAFQALLHRYTGQEDIVVGSPTASRERPEFGSVFGFFVNTVAVRADLGGNPRFAELLGRTRTAVFTALEHQGVPLVRVVERVQPQRDASRSPLFQVMYVHQQVPPAVAAPAGLAALALGTDGGQVQLGGLTLEAVPLPRRAAQFDLLLSSADAGDRLDLSLEYNTDLLDAATVRRMLAHLVTLLDAALADPDLRLSQLPLLTADETRALEAWNATGRDFSGVGLIHEEFAARAAATPAAVAVTYEGAALSYRDLDARSNQLARYLREHGVAPGSVVGIVAERSVELMVGLLGILKAGGAYLPLDPEYPLERLSFITRDAGARLVLATAPQAGAAPAGPVLRLDADWAAVSGYSDRPVEAAAGPDDPAYVIYTSGSTGAPKGVVNTHGAIRNRLAWMQDAYRLGAEDRVLQKTPAGFDVSVWEFFWPLTTGARLVLARPGGHRDAAYLVELIERAGVTTVHFVPSMLRHFLDEPDLHRCAPLRRVVCSGEALPGALVRRFFQRVPGRVELHNLYGPTEAAVDVTGWRCDPGDPRETIPIGYPIANVTIHLLDPYGNRVPVGVPGELYIGGAAPAAGYLNRPELTAQRFLPDPFSTDPDARLFRTGDLARRAADGSIEFLGRLDHQIKLHGNRVELAEIEACLLDHPGVAAAVVTAVGSPAPTELVAYVVSAEGAGPDVADLRELLGRRLPQYMVPGRYVTLAALPLTPTGKVDRRALPAPGGAYRPASGAAVAPRTPEERALAGVLAEVLGVAEVGVRDNFFELGGDSIRALQVRAGARAVGLDLAIPDLLRYPTVEGMARVATPVPPDGDRQETVPPFALVPAADRDALPPGLLDAFPLALLQTGLVFHSEFSPDYETYVMGFHLGGRFDEAAMRGALDRLSARHAMLRTSLDLSSFSESLQLVHPTATIPLRVWDLRDTDPGEQDAEVERFMAQRRWLRFDWTRAPLLHVDVHLRGSTSDAGRPRGPSEPQAPLAAGFEESFQLTLSHPFFDGWSMALLVTELVATYSGLAGGAAPQPAAPPRLTFADFVALEMAAVRSDEHRRFWAAQLAGAPRTELPRWPSRRTPAPSQHRRTTVRVDPEVRDALRRLSVTAGTSLKSVLLAAHVRSVGLVTGQDDVTTGILANGRPEELDGERIVGVFLNTVPLRMRLDGGTWRDLVRQTLGAEREVLPYRRYPFAEIVRTLGAGTAPFETAFNYIHFHVYEALLQVDGARVLGWTNPSDQTYFPLTAYFHLDVASGDLLFHLDTDDAVLDPEQVLAIRDCYLATLAAMAGDPDGRYQSRSLLPTADAQRIVGWNATVRNLPPDWVSTVHGRFAAQARQRPDAVAVRCAGTALSYGELDRRANQLAHRLRRYGVGAGDTVGIALRRRVELVVALLGVLKTGAAYVPMDPSYPRERLRHMRNDSGAAVVLTESAVVGSLPDEPGVTVLHLDEEADVLAAEPAGPPGDAPDPDALAYVIYTSGSTGVPKGVEISHGALDNLLLAFTDALAWTPDETLLAVTTLSFDIAGLELFLPLTTGACLELATEAEVVDPERLAALVDGAGASLMQATPATWRMLVDAGWVGSPRLRVLCGGEALTADLADALRPRCRELWNVYGPTETTIWSTAVRLDDLEGVPSIGRPLANTRCHVLDRHGQPVPVGVPGELYLAGAGLARGYRNRRDLTAHAFVPGRAVGEQRMYRTGDLVRWRPDGLLEYLGRLDAQVKVRGFRIELGEIESVLGTHPDVRQAVALARTDGMAEARLVAYVVPQPGVTVDLVSLRAAVAARLPAYMMPSVFVVLDELPQTPNGKVDRRALPAPPDERPSLAGEFAAPRTDMERQVAGIWRDLLGVERVGIDDPFFEVGGHSLLMVRVHSRIRKEITDVPIGILFEHPTVRRLAGYLSSGGGADDLLAAARARGAGRRRPPAQRRSPARVVSEE